MACSLAYINKKLTTSFKSLMDSAFGGGRLALPCVLFTYCRHKFEVIHDCNVNTWA